MSKGKLIIKFDGVSELEALDYVRTTVAKGRISKARGRHHFCFLSLGKDGTNIIAREKQYDSAPDSFVVRRLNAK